MSWQRIEPPAARKASQISVSLSVVKGKGRITISVPSAVAAQLGFEKPEYAEVRMGNGDNAGKVWIAPGGSDFKIGRLKHCVTIRPPVPHGVTLRDNSASVDYEAGPDKCGIVFAMPAWLLPVSEKQRMESAGAPNAARPGSLEVNGNLLVMGVKQLGLTKSEAIVMRLLVKNWNSCVARREILSELYSLDPNGGADDKIIDVWISKLRAKLEEKQFDLLIVTHRGSGWELRRNVA